MSGSVWGNTKALIENLAKPETPEERQARLDREAEEKARREAQALDDAAQRLCNRVEEKCDNYSVGDLSSNYINDYQHEVSGSWTTAQIELAYTKWKALYSGRLDSLNVHKMGPAQKWTGDRDGKVQANFIRYVDTTRRRRINVHINWKAG